MKNTKDFIFIDGPWFQVTKNGKQKWMRADFVSKEELKTVLAKRADKKNTKSRLSHFRKSETLL